MRCSIFGYSTWRTTRRRPLVKADMTIPQSPLTRNFLAFVDRSETAPAAAVLRAASLPAASRAEAMVVEHPVNLDRRSAVTPVKAYA